MPPPKKTKSGGRTQLTSKQQAFVDAYDGNGTKAARLAGYSGNDNALAVIAAGLLRNIQIATAIQGRQQKENRPLIATRQMRQKFWTEAMLGRGEAQGAELRDRLKASELLGKSEADFTDKLDVQGSITVHVVDPFGVPPSERRTGEGEQNRYSLEANRYSTLETAIPPPGEAAIENDSHSDDEPDGEAT